MEINVSKIDEHNYSQHQNQQQKQAEDEGDGECFQLTDELPEVMCRPIAYTRRMIHSRQSANHHRQVNSSKSSQSQSRSQRTRVSLDPVVVDTTRVAVNLNGTMYKHFLVDICVTKTTAADNNSDSDQQSDSHEDGIISFCGTIQGVLVGEDDDNGDDATPDTTMTAITTGMKSNNHKQQSGKAATATTTTDQLIRKFGILSNHKLSELVSTIAVILFILMCLCLLSILFSSVLLYCIV